MTETFTLTPQQWSELMGRLGTGYGAFDDAVAHLGQGHSFSRTYIVSGRTESEIYQRGFEAVAGNGEGALASVEVRYPRGSQRPASFVVTTDDPRIRQEIAGLGVQGTRSRDADELSRMYGSILDTMRDPRYRMDERLAAMRQLMQGQNAERRQQQPPAPNAGRDRILGDTSRALTGTQFYVASPSALDWMADNDRRQRERDTIGPRFDGPFARFSYEQDYYSPRDGGTGFMRYIEPGGSSSVYVGNRRLYTEFPLTERNEFGRGADRPVGTLRIYGSLDRPERHEVITDNPALRAAMERAHIPVRPSTEPPRERPQRRPE